jgi:hypothetical protein
MVLEVVNTWFKPAEEPVREKKTSEEKPRAVLSAIALAARLRDFDPDELQVRVLESNAHRGILNCSRQWGKSTVGAVMAVHRAMTRPRSLVVVASPSDRQSAEFVRKCREMLSDLKIRVRGDGHNKISIVLPNKSRIIGLPGVDGTVRGFSAVSLMIIDEASRVRPEIYKALRPMLAVGGGDLWLMSTPAGKQGFFHSVWTHGGEEWLKVEAPATLCPRIPAAFLEEERGQMGPAWFRQEYLCEFIEGGSAMVDREVVERAFDSDVEPLRLATQLRTWR